MAQKKKSITICYLCGSSLEGNLSDDHVPPKQFFGKEIRRRHPLSLLKIPTHPTCNFSYKLDEEYFVQSLAPIAQRTYAANAVLVDMHERFRRGEQVPLAHAVLKEFQPQPSGLVLPGGKVIKRFKAARIRRVLWKLVRGLYFHESNLILPADHPIVWEIVPPGEKPPEFFGYVANESSKGKHQAVFAYKTKKVIEDGCCFQVWSFLLWDNLIFLVYFHDPSTCQRPGCDGRLTAK